MSYAEIKYRFALGKDQRIIDVLKLSDADRMDYECAGCGNIVRPVLPKTNRQKHFRHVVQVECSNETYLHRMGKILFEQTYRRCLNNKEPYLIEFKVPIQCNYCEYGPCDNVDEKKKYFDLTTVYKKILIEKRDGEFIPDLLIASEKGEKIYIEIEVTHEVSFEKIQSGIKIIEIGIYDESDLTIFNEKKISLFDPRVQDYNFSPRAEVINSSSMCHRWKSLFLVDKNGKCSIARVNFYKIARIQSQYLYSKEIDISSGYVFVQEAILAFLAGVPVKNCFLCRYHAIARYFQRTDNDEPIFCKFYKKPVKSNAAANCSIYRPDKKVFDMPTDPTP